MEIEQMRIRMGEMAAEIDRLNAEREQLLAQEPVLKQFRYPIRVSDPDLLWTSWGEWKGGESYSGSHQERNLYAQAVPAQQVGNCYDADSVNALVRRLDVALNGEHGAAKQAMLCDIVAQVESQPSPAVAISKTENTTRITEQDAFKTLMRDICEAPETLDDERAVQVDYDWLYSRVQQAFESVGLDGKDRITEQDAREIVSAWLHVDPWDWNKWFVTDGHALLDKLNTKGDSDA